MGLPPLRVLNSGITLSCLIGIGLSMYAYKVESETERDSNYKAMCDIGEKMSCTNVFKSEYAKGFGIIGPLLGKESVFYKPNSLLGLMFYSLIATLAQANSVFTTKVSYLAIVLSNVASVYFAGILLFILKDLCVVCVSTYVVNLCNLILIFYKNKVVSGGTSSSKGSKTASTGGSKQSKKEKSN